MQLTERDYEILQTIYRYDGLLSVNQFHRWFFGVKRRAYYRINALCENKCLQRLKPQDRYRVPEPIVWLDTIGAQRVADSLGIEYSELHWRSQPRWSRVAHDIALNEFRHTFEQAVIAHPGYELEIWQGQGDLERLFPQALPYLDSTGQRRQKVMKPDGYVSLVVQSARPYYLRFLIELDNNTESSKRFGRDKVSPLVHLLLSPEYQQQTEGDAGRVLVVTVGAEARFHYLRAEVTQAGGAPYFLFTRSEWVQPDTLLKQPIFYLPHTDIAFAFSQYHTDDFQARLERSLVHTPRLKTLF